MLSFASRSSPAQSVRLAGPGRKRPDRGQWECTRLAQAALDLLEDGDVRGARKLLAKMMTLTRGAPQPWGAAWAARAPSERPAQPRERPCTPDRGTDAGAVPSLAPVVIEARPAPIRIRALGGFDLSIDGVAFASGVKPQRRPLDLLKVLLVSNERSVGAAELADRLWPDSDGDTARNSLQVAVHRLRRLLGREQAVVVQNRKVCLDHALCAVDLWTFEREAQLLMLACADGPSFAQRAGETLRLYRGHLFAQEAEQAWMLAPRERLRRLWLALVRRLGDHHEAHGDEDRACELYQRAVDLDPLAEEVYRRLMRCQQRAGEPAEAIHTYRCCREQLVAALGVAPSAETERLYHTLRSVA